MPLRRSAVFLLVASLLLEPAGSSSEAQSVVFDLTGPGPRCATVEPVATAAGIGLDPSDCSLTTSNPSPKYDPGTLYTIPVVVHVLMDSSCAQGIVSNEQVAGQIQVLNEDFLALTGSNGEGGTDAQIQFALATHDPEGKPTTGITRHCNTTWFNDDGAYWETLAWDPHRYLNLYSSAASGARGYVPFLPAQDAGALVGSAADRVVVNWLAFGTGGSVPSHNLGRTATHEIGHFLGLYHPYFGGCGNPSPPDCYSSGDLLCDTPPDAAAHDLCPVGAVSCGVAAPIDNYMELTDDFCLDHFTPEQVRRMRCTLEWYRPMLVVGAGIFADGFESGDVGAWSG